MARIYISHGGDPNDWFVVHPNPMGLEPEVDSLVRAGRTVLELDVEPFDGRRDGRRRFRRVARMKVKR